MNLNLMVMGESGVGKTSFLNKYINGEFQNVVKKSSLGFDLFTKTINICNKQINLKLWDTAGQEKFHSITNIYYKKADGLLILFDLNDVNSFQKCSYWINQIKQNNENAQILLVGNKCDLKQEICESLIQQFAVENQITYVKASAKEGVNIEFSIQELAEQTCIQWEVSKEQEDLEVNSQLDLKENLTDKNIFQLKNSIKISKIKNKVKNIYSSYCC